MDAHYKYNQYRTDHKFLVRSQISGHSYMEYDQDFGVIEKSKKRTQHVFVSNDWVNIVKKFKVIRMEIKNFKSIENMQKVVSSK